MKKDVLKIVYSTSVQHIYTYFTYLYSKQDAISESIPEGFFDDPKLDAKVWYIILLM